MTCDNFLRLQGALTRARPKPPAPSARRPEEAKRTPRLKPWPPGNRPCTTAVELGGAMIVMAVIGGAIVAGLAWAGVYDYRRRGRGARPSIAEAFRRQSEIDRQRLSEAAPGGDTTGGGGV